MKGAEIRFCKFYQVIGNQFLLNAGVGLALLETGTATAHMSIVANNHVMNNGQLSNDTYDGLVIVGHPDEQRTRILLEGNWFGNDAGLGNTYQRDGVRLDTSSGGVNNQDVHLFANPLLQRIFLDA